MLRSLAVHGKSGNDKYINIRLGLNSRLDTLQAAILLVKFKAFCDYELKDINEVAAMYSEEFSKYRLDNGIKLPIVRDGFYSSWAQYTIQLPEIVDRSALQAKLKESDIPTMVYYMKPMHRQGAFENTYSAKADCPITDKLCSRVLSLPIHPYMTKENISAVVEEICSFMLSL